MSECEPGQNCCSGTCCDFPCYECIEEGTLTGGSVSGDPDPVCGGNTITFTVSGVTDSGGQERVDCHVVGIPPVTPTYTWVITQPVGSPINGSGPIATVEVDETGQYTCRFTATANRNCSPSPLVLDPETVTAEEIDLDVDSDNDGDIDEADDAIEDSAYTPQTPGKWLWINNDDTDGDGLPDNANQIIDSIDDLDDVPELWIRAIDSDLVPPGGTLYLETSDADVLRVFDGRWSGAVGVLGPQTGSTHQINPIPTSGDVQYGIEGVAPGTAELTLLLKDGGAVICQDTVQVTVVGLEVAWETTANQPITDSNGHPDAGIGVQYFPGATTPGGGWNDSVQVRIATDPPVDGLNIYLKAFDPDDPSAKDNVVDNDLNGGDNRDAAHGDTSELSATQTSTDATGEAVVQFRVAHQPGDNHRIAATLKQMALDTLNDNNVPPSGTDPGTEDQVELFTGNISPLLTVWRKLHVEVDSMTAEPSTVSGRCPDWDLLVVDSVVTNPPTNSTTLIVTSQTTGSGELPSSETNHYEGGTLTVPGFSEPLFIVESTSYSLEVDRILTGAEMALVIGPIGTLRDDDPDTNPGQLPSFPTFSDFVIGVYANAYIEITDIPEQYNPRPTVVFDLNLTDWEVRTGQGWDNSQDVFSSDPFWAALLVIGYQSGAYGDQDSDAWLGDNSNQWGVNYDPDTHFQIGVTVEDSDNASVVFIEVIRDIGAQAGNDLDHTIAHEIGHSAGHNTSAEQDHAELGIMTKGAPDDEDSFTPATLKRFRESNPW